MEAAVAVTRLVAADTFPVAAVLVDFRVAAVPADFQVVAVAEDSPVAAVNISRRLAAAHVRSLVRADSQVVKVLLDGVDFQAETGDSPAANTLLEASAGAGLSGATADVALTGAGAEATIAAAGFMAADTTAAIIRVTATDSATTEITAIPMATTISGVIGIPIRTAPSILMLVAPTMAATTAATRTA